MKTITIPPAVEGGYDASGRFRSRVIRQIVAITPNGQVALFRR